MTSRCRRTKKATCVPSHWIVSTSEDAEVAAALREVLPAEKPESLGDSAPWHRKTWDKHEGLNKPLDGMG
jgi:hypothetical protein